MLRLFVVGRYNTCLTARLPNTYHEFHSAQMGSEVLTGEEDTDLTGEVKADGAAAGSQAPSADETRLTTKYMTKYERARIIGTRALQLRYAKPRCEHCAKRE